MPLQGALAERNLFLTLANIASIGVGPTDVVCQYRKNGQPGFSTKTLDSSSWSEVGNGFYILRFSPSDMDTLGDFIFTLASVKFDNFNFQQFEVTPVPEGLVVPPPDLCIITGFLRDIGGNIPRNCRVTVRPVEFPSKYGSNIINADKVTAYPDLTSGQFQLTLVRGSTVVVEIDRTGLRNQITVPDAPTANLIDLLAPFPIDIIT